MLLEFAVATASIPQLYSLLGLFPAMSLPITRNKTCLGNRNLWEFENEFTRICYRSPTRLAFSGIGGPEPSNEIGDQEMKPGMRKPLKPHQLAHGINPTL